MIDRDTVIDLVALVDTEFMQLKAGTYNGFDISERFALYVEAKVRAEEREAIAKLIEEEDEYGFKELAQRIRARGQK
jgi:hypothetical protein